jgi:outer membrane protein TolC
MTNSCAARVTWLVLVLALHAVTLRAEDSASARPSGLLSQVDSPPSPNRLWSQTGLDLLSAGAETPSASPVEVGRVYDLPELIDLAERSHPETRVAWERAKQAAESIGLAKSEYYPILAIRASAGIAREPAPLPLTSTQAAFMNVEARDAEPAAVLEWTLFDFGRRKQNVLAARGRLLAANLGFNARHEEIVYAVQTAFYELTKARGQIEVAHSSLTAAQKVEQAVAERAKQGLATGPERSRARQQEAEAAFELTDVLARERDAQVALAESVGILPTTPLHVVDFSSLPIPNNLGSSVEAFVQRTLKQRPDLLAGSALVLEKEAEIRKAAAAYYPTLQLQGSGGGEFWRAGIELQGEKLPWAYTRPATWSAGLAFNWTVFDGSARRHALAEAKSEREEALRQLDRSRDDAISQVWQYYSDAKLALDRLPVAAALVDASEKSYGQTFSSYRNGLSSLVDLLAARQELSQAQFAQLDTRATVLESVAALAFASGDLGPELIDHQTKP